MDLSNKVHAHAHGSQSRLRGAAGRIRTYNEGMLIEGIYAAITTPFYPDERLYLRKLEANVTRYSRSLLSGLLVLGSTGEAVELSDAEAREVLRTAAGAAAPEKVLIAGVSRESVKGTVELSEAAADAQYDAVLVHAPTYYVHRLDESGILHYFRSVADRSPLPVLLYNNPKCVPYSLPVRLVAELAQHPNIIGVKESAGDIAQLRAILDATRNAPTRTVTVTPVFEAVTGRMLLPQVDVAAAFISANDLLGGATLPVIAAPPALKTRTKDVGFQVLAGSSSILLDALLAGASGGVLAFAACAPQACQEIHQAWKDHDIPLATEKQQRIIAPNRRITGELGVSGIKYACDFNGYYGGYARAPLPALTSGEKAEIEELLKLIRN